jgi:hypothetical protein
MSVPRSLHLLRLERPEIKSHIYSRKRRIREEGGSGKLCLVTRAHGATDIEARVYLLAWVEDIVRVKEMFELLEDF